MDHAIDQSQGNQQENSMNPINLQLWESDLIVMVRRMMTQIAIQLHCSRVVWKQQQQQQQLPIHLIYPGKIQPNRLKEWILVHWTTIQCNIMSINIKNSNNENTQQNQNQTKHVNHDTNQQQNEDEPNLQQQQQQDTQQKQSPPPPESNYNTKNILSHEDTYQTIQQCLVDSQKASPLAVLHQVNNNHSDTSCKGK
jgi:hypothetical protein